LQHRLSSLTWPRQNHPACAALQKRNNFLQHFHRCDKLLTPLGAWTTTPHQDWNWYSHPHEGKVYCHHYNQELWAVELPQTGRYITRWNNILYDMDDSHPCLTTPTLLVSTAVTFHHDSSLSTYFLSKKCLYSSPPPCNEPQHEIWSGTIPDISC
jgi:hypothetical protein